MNTYYDLLTELKNEIDSIPLVNVCTQGQIDDIDINKQSIFPLVHLDVVNAVPTQNAVEFTIVMVIMDLVDISKETPTDLWVGNDNEMDVLNNTFTIGMRIYESLRRGNLWDRNIQLGNFTMDKFTERFENYLSGWTCSFSVFVKNDMSIC